MNRLLAFIWLVPVTSFGAWTLVDDFDLYSAGALTGNGGWTADALWTVTGAPNGGDGNVASGLTSAANARAYKALSPSIPDTSTSATLFMRMYRSGLVNMSLGLSDDAVPALFGGYEAQINAQHNTAPTDSLKVRDAGAFDDLGAGTFADQTWYNVWMVINNSANTYQLWVDQGNFGSPTLALTHVLDPNGGAGDFDFGFRNGAATNALGTLVMGMGGATVSGTLMVDDVYVDTAGANLTSPVPEPATGAFLILGSAAGLLRRRSGR